MDIKKYWFCLGFAAALHLIAGRWDEYDKVMADYRSLSQN